MLSIGAQKLSGPIGLRQAMLSLPPPPTRPVRDTPPKRETHLRCPQQGRKNAIGRFEGA